MTISKTATWFVVIGAAYLTAISAHGQREVGGPEITNRFAYGLPAPGLAPELFAYDLLGSDDAQLALAIAPDHEVLYFTQARIGQQGISFELRKSTFTYGEWTPVKPVSFGSEHGDLEVFFNTSGSRLYFFSKRPAGEGLEPASTPNLWYVDKQPQAWGPPVLLGKPGTAVKHGWSAALLDDSTLYFTARPHENPGLADIYEVSIEGDQFGAARSIGEAVNTPEYTENEPAIAPDGDYMVFCSAGRPDNLSAELLGDLYISFRDAGGGWQEAIHLEEPINSAAEENWPRFSPDGQFLFFSSNRRDGTQLPDLYWVSTEALLKYRED